MPPNPHAFVCPPPGRAGPNTSTRPWLRTGRRRRTARAPTSSCKGVLRARQPRWRRAPSASIGRAKGPGRAEQFHAMLRARERALSEQTDVVQFDRGATASFAAAKPHWATSARSRFAPPPIAMTSFRARRPPRWSGTRSRSSSMTRCPPAVMRLPISTRSALSSIASSIPSTRRPSAVSRISTTTVSSSCS